MRRRRRFGFACLILCALLFISLSASPKVSADDPPVEIGDVLDLSINPIFLFSAGLSGGNVGIVYASFYDGIPRYKVMAPSGDEVFEKDLFALGINSLANLYEIKAIGLSGGRSLVSWRGFAGGCGGPYQFMILDQDGNPVKGPTDINTENGSHLCTGQAVELSNGNIVFVWKHGQNEYKYRVFDGNGEPLTDPLTVQNGGDRPEDLEIGDISRVYLAANDQGRFLIAYSSGKNHVGTLYNSDGTRIPVNGYHHFDLQPNDSNDTYGLYGAAGLDNGKFAILYDTSADEVIIQIVNPDGTVAQTISADKGAIISETGFANFYLRGLKNGQVVLAGISGGNLSRVRQLLGK
jgi:hypothetical protein